MWRVIYKLKLIPKIGFFLWLVVRDRLLTLDNLRKRGLIVRNRCILCGRVEEMINHLLLFYEFTKKVWNQLWQKGNIRG